MGPYSVIALQWKGTGWRKSYLDQFLSTPFSKLLKLINIQIYPGKGRLYTVPSHHHPFCQSPMSSIHRIQSQCGSYSLGKTFYGLCVDNNLCFNTKVVCICRSIKAVGGAVVMVSADTLHQIVSPLSSVHLPPMLVISWWWQCPGPRVTLRGPDDNNSGNRPSN